MPVLCDIEQCCKNSSKAGEGVTGRWRVPFQVEGQEAHGDLRKRRKVTGRCQRAEGVAGEGGQVGTHLVGFRAGQWGWQGCGEWRKMGQVREWPKARSHRALGVIGGTRVIVPSVEDFELER